MSVDVAKSDDGRFRVKHGGASFCGSREQCGEWLLSRARAIEIRQVMELRKAAGRVYKL